MSVFWRDYQWQSRKYLLNQEPLYIISRDEFNVHDLPSYKKIDYKTDSSLKEIMNRWWMQEFASPASVEMEVDRLDTQGTGEKRIRILHRAGDLP